MSMIPQEDLSPLRPKSIHPALAAAAERSTDLTRPSVLHCGEGEALVPPADAASSLGPFELPENVAHRPGAKEVAKGAPGTSYARKRQRAGLTGDAERKRQRPAKRSRLTGPERAAFRRRRQQLAKRAVCRRVGLWRSRTVDGEQQVVYITLGGEVLKKGSRAFRAATADQRYLKACGIASFRPTSSSIEVPEEIEPYASRRGESPLELSYWCIPESVEACYRDAGICRLHAWQAECLNNSEVLAGRSLVYVAPTSAGKSLVSEVLMLRQLLFRGRRALVILPYVSICEERVRQLRGSCGAVGLRVEGLYSSSDGKWHAGADVAVCTIEKASALLNRLLEDDALLRDIGVVIVDEMHLLAEEHRGYLLELILIKSRLSATMTAPTAGGGLQIIGLSATLPNVNLLADWLGAKLYICHDRPVPLTMSVAKNSASRVSQRDSDGLVPLVWECVASGQSVLTFCATKDWCEKAASLLAEELPKLAKGPPSEEAQNGRLRLVEELKQAPSGLCPVLAATVPRGVAYHHAGLTVEERNLLEDAYRKGVLCCLCATSTLAAGVNLPARRVIIRSMKVGSASLDAIRFRQMAGRAGRVGLDTKGECVVMARTARDIEEAESLFSAEMQPLKSSLTGQRLVRAILEVVSLGLIRTMADLEGGFARSLLRFHEEKQGRLSQMDEDVPRDLLQDIRGALSYLKAQKLVRVDEMANEASPNRLQVPGESGDYGSSQSIEPVISPEAMLMATPLGDGVVHSALRPAEALSVFEDLQRARQGLCLDSDLHLIFLVTPATSMEPDWSRYITYYEKLQPRDRAVASAVGVSPDFLLKQSMGHRGPLSTGTNDWRQDRERVTTVHRRFWAALALRELMAETSAGRVATAFAASRGSLQGLQGMAATYCGMVRQLCERLRWHEMAALFECLMPRLNFGATPEALPLCRIPGVYPARARALLQAGLASVEDIAKSSVFAVESALGQLYQFESCRTEAALAQHQEAVIRDAALKILHGAQRCVNEDLQQLEDEAEAEQAALARGMHRVKCP
ncbi:unnamed protein product [Effrenium voratum]|uniref:DNA polymerase theta n=1 Tax=Effrenium voratum TaxID=2562239 RepID=A0AA36IGZ0_9DINO|nr:unnamed protein product [Effrenium voratum]